MHRIAVLVFDPTRDADGGEAKSAFLTDLDSPFGMALVREDLYVAKPGRGGCQVLLPAPDSVK